MNDKMSEDTMFVKTVMLPSNGTQGFDAPRVGIPVIDPKDRAGTSTLRPSFRDIERPGLTLNEYQKFAKQTAIYPTAQAIEYCTLGLAGEAGEVANKVKKFIRDGQTETSLIELVAEISDCLWYVAMLSHECGYSLQDVAEMNLAKLKDRQDRDALKGSGDNR